ncbi:MAG: hypothetical protein ACE5OP_12435 [Candidatus Glassbacteria bacterium]
MILDVMVKINGWLVREASGIFFVQSTARVLVLEIDLLIMEPPGKEVITREEGTEQGNLREFSEFCGS